MNEHFLGYGYAIQEENRIEFRAEEDRLEQKSFIAQGSRSSVQNRDRAEWSKSFFFFKFCGGTLGTAATTGLLYQPRMIGDGDCGEIGGMRIGRGNRNTRRKPAPAPLCPPQIPHD
jgi:hypothetical protein